jgi:hypothetical protein
VSDRCPKPRSTASTEQPCDRNEGLDELGREFGGAALFHRKPRPRLSELGAAIRPELERALAHLKKALAHARPSPHRAAASTRQQMQAAYVPQPLRRLLHFPVARQRSRDC